MLNTKLTPLISIRSMLLTLAAAALMGGVFVATARAATSDVTQLKITTSAQTGEVGTPSSVMTVETEDASGTKTKVDSTETLTFTSDSSTGQFSDASITGKTCTLSTLSSSLTLTLASASYEKGFCYQDSTPGAHTITVTDQSQSWTAASQSFSIPLITNDASGSFTSIQDAIAGTADGDTITIPAGIYDLSSEIDISKPLSLSGQGNVTFLADNSSWDTTNNGKHMLGIYAGTQAAPITISNITFDCNSQCYGLNTYNNAYGVLNNVTIKNSKGAALTVNGSTITASGLTTSGNSWGAVNVDPGSGVTTPSVFTLSSGTLSENTQIWSDGGNVTNTATVTVNASGYTKYRKGGTTSFFVWNNHLLDVATLVAADGMTDFYTNIQDAIDVASSSATINVASGSYSGNLTINKPLTLKGVQAGIAGSGRSGNESLIGGTINVQASNVTIDGFTINGPDNSSAVLMQGAYTGETVKNNIIYNHGYAVNFNTGSTVINGNSIIHQTDSTSGIEANSDPGNNLTFSSNVFSGNTLNSADITVIGNSNSPTTNVSVSGNTSTSGSTLISLFRTASASIANNILTGNTSNSAVYIGGSDSNLTVSGNTIKTYTSGINVAHDFGQYGVNSSIAITNNILNGNTNGIKVGSGAVASTETVTAHDNQISGNAAYGVLNASAGSVDAASNWWGKANPDVSTLVSGTVTATPWCTDNACSATRSANVFIDLNGNNSFDAATETNYPTITAALNAIPAASVSAPNSIVVLSGVYNENLTFDKPTYLHSFLSTDTGYPVAALHGTIQVANNIDNEISALEITASQSIYGIYLHNAGETNIDNNWIHDIGTGLTGGNSAQAIYVQSSSDVNTININRNLIQNIGNNSIGQSNKGIFIGDSTSTGDISAVSITNNTIENVVAASTSYHKGAYGLLVNRKASNLKVTGNTIKNLDGFWAHAIGMEGDTPSATVTGNTITNLTSMASDAVGVHFESDASASAATVSGNSFGSNVAKGVDNTNGSSDVVTADDNWWNSPSGPTGSGAATASSDVTVNVWYIDPGMKILSTAVSGGTVTASTNDFDFVASSSGQASLPSGVSSITLSNTTVLNLSNNVATASGNTITINGSQKSLTNFTSGTIASADLAAPITVGNKSVTVSKAVALKSGSSGTPINISNSALSNVSVAIPDSTTVLAPSGWDGKIQPPKTVSSSGTTAPSGFSVGGTVVEVGSPDGVLLFDKPVSVVLTGVTGNVAYLPSGSTTWVQITNQCSGTYDNPGTPTFPGECYISANGNTKIYTYHFTTFGQLTPSTSNTQSGSSYTSQSQATATPVPTSTPVATPAATPAPTKQPAATPKPAATPASSQTKTSGGQTAQSGSLSQIAENSAPVENNNGTANPLYSPYPQASGQQASILGAIGKVLNLGTGQWWMAVLVLALIALGISGFIRRLRRNNIKFSDKMDDSGEEEEK